MPTHAINSNLQAASSPSRTPWFQQCVVAAVEHIRSRFGVDTALDYIVGEKLANYLEFSHLRPGFQDDLQPFVSSIRKNFPASDLPAYFAHVLARRGGSHRRRAALKQARLLLLPLKK